MARLTAAERRKLPSSDFAIPSERKYPDFDAGHRKAALGRVGEYGSPSQKRKVRADVARKSRRSPARKGSR